MKKSGESGDLVGTHTLRNLKPNTVSSYPRRGNDSGSMILSDDPQAWASEGRSHVSIGQDSTEDGNGRSDGISKTTTVTVSIGT